MRWALSSRWLALVAGLCGQAMFLAGVEIPAGTRILMQVENSVSTRTAKQGDVVYLRSVAPIIVGDKVIAPPGCYGQARVTHVKRGGRLRGRAELGLKLESLALPSGRVLRVAGSPAGVEEAGSGQAVSGSEGLVRQGSGGENDAATVAKRGAQGAALGAIVDRSARGAAIGAGAGGAAGLAQVLLTRGKDVELRRGMTVDLVLERGVVLE